MAANPQTAEDVGDLVTYVRQNAPSLGIDPKRLGVWSPSAGVPFGVRVALHGSPEYMRAAAFYYGELLHRQEEFSALSYLSSGQPLPALFIAKAANDRSSINDSITEFVNGARLRGTPLVYMEHESGQHAFDLLNDDDRSREIIKATLDFFTATLLRGELPAQQPLPTATVPLDNAPTQPAGAAETPAPTQGTGLPDRRRGSRFGAVGHCASPGGAVVGRDASARRGRQAITCELFDQPISTVSTTSTP